MFGLIKVPAPRIVEGLRGGLKPYLNGWISAGL